MVCATRRTGRVIKVKTPRDRVGYSQGLTSERGREGETIACKICDLRLREGMEAEERL